jgi:hypothetical protein
MNNRKEAQTISHNLKPNKSEVVTDGLCFLSAQNYILSASFQVVFSGRVILTLYSLTCSRKKNYTGSTLASDEATVLCL